MYDPRTIHPDDPGRDSDSLREEFDVSNIRELISRGEYLRAYELGERSPGGPGQHDPERTGLHALCMSRLGMTDGAIELLENTDGIHPEEDPQLSALLGSFYKRRWLEMRSSDPDEAMKALTASFENYMRSRSLGCDYWCTVNAASLATFLDRRDLSLELAEEVISQCWEEYNRHGTTSEYWIPASMGEAYLIRGDYGTSARWYGSAASHLCGRLGQIKSARTNAMMLIESLDIAEDEASRILDSIRIPRIVVFAGHRIDRPGHSAARFPDSIASRVKKRLRKSLLGLRPDIGVASAADGGDLIFHECLIEMGRSTHVILPSPVRHFRSSLEEISTGGWLPRFDRVLENAHRIEISSTSRFEHDSSEACRMAADYMLEYAAELAESFGGDLTGVVIWDERSNEQPGGTGYVVAAMRRMGLEPVKVSVNDLTGKPSSSVKRRDSVDVFPYRENSIYEPVARPLAVVRPSEAYSSEEKLASDLSRLSTYISGLCAEHSVRILSASSISDRVCLVPESVEDACRLCAGLADIPEGLPAVSLLLHAGLVMMLDSTMTGRRDYYCREMNEAIEASGSLRMPGQLVTMQFRAMLERSTRREKKLDYRYYGLVRRSDGGSLKLFRIM